MKCNLSHTVTYFTHIHITNTDTHTHKSYMPLSVSLSTVQTIFNYKCSLIFHIYPMSNHAPIICYCMGKHSQKSSIHSHIQEPFLNKSWLHISHKSGGFCSIIQYATQILYIFFGLNSYNKGIIYFNKFPNKRL